MADTAHAIMGSLFSFNGCIMGYVCEETSLISSIRTPADLAVSWLNFEPRVSKLPAVSADVADTAHAIIGSLFSFNGCIIGYVCEETSLIVVKDGSKPFGFIAGNATMGSLFSFYS